MLPPGAGLLAVLDPDLQHVFRHAKHEVTKADDSGGPFRPASVFVIENEPPRLGRAGPMSIYELYWWYSARGKLWLYYLLFPPP